MNLRPVCTYVLYVGTLDEVFHSILFIIIDQKMNYFVWQVDWRQKLDTQRGAVLANELKNNACKLAKWTVQSILAGADNLKFGYVTRYNVKDSSRHVILGTQQFKPIEFGQQINLNMDNAWGVVRCILDLIMAQKVE